MSRYWTHNRGMALGLDLLALVVGVVALNVYAINWLVAVLLVGVAVSLAKHAGRHSERIQPWKPTKATGTTR